jgi:hypothetical protein
VVNWWYKVENEEMVQMANTDTASQAALAIATGGTAATEYVEALRAYAEGDITTTDLAKAEVALANLVGQNATRALESAFYDEFEEDDTDYHASGDESVFGDYTGV